MLWNGKKMWLHRLPLHLHLANFNPAVIIAFKHLILGECDCTVNVILCTGRSRTFLFNHISVNYRNNFLEYARNIPEYLYALTFLFKHPLFYIFIGWQLLNKKKLLGQQFGKNC